MRHLEVLVVAKDITTPKILNWKISTVNNVETAIEKLQLKPFKVVAISKEISKTDKMKLKSVASILFSNVILIEFNDVTTLSESVKKAYWSQKKPGGARNYLDNSFEIKLANSISLN